jgi:CubicO group peptidase (beta-lactamase class C family)
MKLWLLLTPLLTDLAFAACHNLSPAFPPPTLTKQNPFLEVLYSNLTHKLNLLGSEDKYDATSFSIALTSRSELLWDYHHTAQELDPERPGATPVDGNSYYRIASITKIFTTHAILDLHAAGKLDLDESVQKYLPRLNGSGIAWKDITLRSLAGQSSGLPRDCTSIKHFSDGHFH